MIFITITSKINMEIKQNYHSDTDSLCYEIESNDVYQHFWNNKNKFDNSDYPENSQFYDKSNKKVIGKFKDEASGIPITEFIGLRSKMYSYIKDNDQNNKTAKGIKKIVIKKNIKHDKYKGTRSIKQQTNLSYNENHSKGCIQNMDPRSKDHPRRPPLILQNYEHKNLQTKEGGEVR